MLLALLPVVGVGAAALSGGQLEFRVEGSYSPEDGVRIGEGIVRASGVRIGPDGGGEVRRGRARLDRTIRREL